MAFSVDKLTALENKPLKYSSHKLPSLAKLVFKGAINSERNNYLSYYLVQKDSRMPLLQDTNSKSANHIEICKTDTRIIS